MNTKKLFFWIGLALIADGFLSIIWGKSCSDMCFNNQMLGQYVRIIRIIMGGALVYFNR